MADTWMGLPCRRSVKRVRDGGPVPAGLDRSNFFTAPSRPQAVPRNSNSVPPLLKALSPRPSWRKWLSATSGGPAEVRSTTSAHYSRKGATAVAFSTRKPRWMAGWLDGSMAQACGSASLPSSVVEPRQLRSLIGTCPRGPRAWRDNDICGRGAYSVFLLFIYFHGDSILGSGRPTATSLISSFAGSSPPRGRRHPAVGVRPSRKARLKGTIYRSPLLVMHVWRREGLWAVPSGVRRVWGRSSVSLHS